MSLKTLRSAWAIALGLALLTGAPAWGAWMWFEGERPMHSTLSRHPWWYDQVQREQFSRGDFNSHFNNERPGDVFFQVAAPQAGKFRLWVRCNPEQAKLSYKLNGGEWIPIDLTKAVDVRNVAADQAADLRFLGWVDAGELTLRENRNYIAFRMHSEKHHHGFLDCFVLTNEPFLPRGPKRPDQDDAAEAGWFAFNPMPDTFAASAMDLRPLNEKNAGDGGFIRADNGRFVHGTTGQSVRFWAVNASLGVMPDAAAARRAARLLAKRGVNLVRLHAAVFNERGDIDPAKVRLIIDIVESLKSEGIYSHLSIYFPLWFQPPANTPWLTGYDGKKHPFAALFFNPDFQQHYRGWWTTLLQTPSLTTGRKLIDEPALMGAEIINEDSYFFWTFSEQQIPDPQLRILEKQFGDWLKTRHGSIDAALAAWKLKVGRDRPAEGRVGFRPLWNLFSEATLRDRDTARFLAEHQRGFYEQTIAFLRQTGFKGVITTSNWTTASPERLGPIEKYTYTAGDFIDRHGYFGCNIKGENSEWALRNGHTYNDRSALRFDAVEPAKPKLFQHLVMDPSYDNKPSMISESAWNRPNRYRSEAPLFLAAYGALQDSDAIVHFAIDGLHWAVKPNFHMQPWTLMSPASMGQFPATALIYRKGLIGSGEMIVELNLKIDAVLNLQGTPLPQDAAFDELRLKDVPKGTQLLPGNRIDPLVHFIGRTNVNFTRDGGPQKLADLKPWLDRAAQTVTSTTGQLRLDYGKGILTINAPAAQGLSGALKTAGPTDLADLAIASDLEIGHIIAVSLDDAPLSRSQRILLQVMSEEKNTDFRSEPAGPGLQRIASIGTDPWLVRELHGTVKFKRPDAAQLKVTLLDPNGYPKKPAGTAADIQLDPKTVYYLIESK